MIVKSGRFLFENYLEQSIRDKNHLYCFFFFEFKQFVTKRKIGLAAFILLFNQIDHVWT